MNKTTITALVTGFPPGLISPKPLPGENILQLVIRNHPNQWQNCIEYLKRNFNLNDEFCSRLRKGEYIESLDPNAAKEIQRFMNYRLPSHGRTLQGLAEVREDLMKSDGLGELLNIALTEIIWPRPMNPNSYTQAQAEKLAESLGVEIVNIDADKQGSPLDINSFMNKVHGDYLWILPGGTRIFSFKTETELFRIFSWFKKNPKLALYTDQCYCMIYRTSALRALMLSGKILSTDVRENARMLDEAGFELTADKEPILVELESIYGGQYDSHSRIQISKRDPISAGKKSWWQRLLRSR